MRQQALYEPIKLWLENKGFLVLITGRRMKVVIPVSDLLPAAYKIPDLIGVNERNRVVIVEAEKDGGKFLNALGTCMLWRCTATYVHLAFPKGKIPRAPALSRLGIGLLEVDTGTRTVNELIALPEKDSDLHALWELHPTDLLKERHLADQIRNNLA
jgi:hypothetical protein